ncbi:MAG: hypothetical protein LBC82_09440 [Oscillospiraceae bacterium]|jgi:hypothetical protein|nr:hypothetical protein [Oscillospiraceae bacterium]
MNKRILWITRTALFIALLIALQAATAALGNQFVTGSVINLILIISVMTCGFATGSSVAVLSPGVAFLFGVGPTQFPVIIPFISLGNFVLVLLWFLIGNRNIINKYISYITALIAGAAGKFLVLYIGVVQIASLFFILPAPILVMMSFPQLITASIGGTIAIIILPVLRRALKYTKS